MASLNWKSLVDAAKEYGITPSALVDEVRAIAIERHVSPEILAQANHQNISYPKPKGVKELAPDYTDHTQMEAELSTAADLWMTNKNFHTRYRLQGDKPADFDLLRETLPEYAKADSQALQEYFANVYDLSILPIHLSSYLSNAMRYFTPPNGFLSKEDPYGVKESHSVITAPSPKSDSGNIYVATRHPGYATYLFTLTTPAANDPTKGTFLCPVGCFACYRGAETRNKKSISISDTGEGLLASKIGDQAKALITHWEAGVNDILISGGEPLLFPNKLLKESVLEPIKEAMKDPNGNVKDLKSLRICTGSLGLGLFARFDDELIQILTDFRNETGVEIGINAHIAHPEQFTPEMMETSKRLREARVRIMPQVPLIEGVNFFNNDPNKTADILAEIADKATFTLGNPVYKFIVDMQQGTSLLAAMQVNNSLFEKHQGRSNIVRPTSFELFVDQPGLNNANLSYHTLSNIRATYSDDSVEFRFDHATGGEVIWKEPLRSGVNDKETFDELTSDLRRNIHKEERPQASFRQRVQGVAAALLVGVAGFGLLKLSQKDTSLPVGGSTMVDPDMGLERQLGVNIQNLEDMQKRFGGSVEINGNQMSMTDFVANVVPVLENLDSDKFVISATGVAPERVYVLMDSKSSSDISPNSSLGNYIEFHAR